MVTLKFLVLKSTSLCIVSIFSRGSSANFTVSTFSQLYSIHLQRERKKDGHLKRERERATNFNERMSPIHSTIYNCCLFWLLFLSYCVNPLFGLDHIFLFSEFLSLSLLPVECSKWAWTFFFANQITQML